MRNLIRLEIKKFKLFSYLKAVVIANLVILGFIYLIYFPNEPFETYDVAFADIGTLIRPVFTIFASVLISRLVIEEYKTNSISLMFMYPIKRKKIMLAKISIVVGFTFMTIFLSNIFIGSVIYLVYSSLHIVPSTLTMELLKESFLSMTLGAIATAGMGLIPLYFGMRKKSVPATIVSSIILVSLTSSTNGGVTAFSIIAIPITLAVIGCLVAYFSIRNIERADV